MSSPGRFYARRNSWYARLLVRTPAVSGSMRAAVSALTKLLARRFGPEGIRVNSVLPWVVLDPADDWESSEIPLSRAATYEQLAGVVSVLCSGGGSYLTGVNLPVDGGWSKGL